MRRVDRKIVPVTIIAIGLSLFFIKQIFQYEAMVGQTLGPGIYPLVILILIIVASSIITVKAFAQPEYQIISPYPAGSVKGVLIKKIADILAEELNSSVMVVSKPGEGFFSANYAGSRAKPDGKTLTVITGDKPSSPNFLGVSVSVQNFEPILGLTFEPDILVLRSRTDTQSDSTNTTQFLQDLLNMKIGFSHSEEVPYYLREALSKKSGIEIKGSFFNDAQFMLEALEKGDISAGFCPLSSISNKDGFRDKYHIVAVASSERVRELPNTPTFEELGIDLLSGQWMGLGCPRGTDKNKVEQIYSILTEPNHLKTLKGEMEEKRQQQYLKEPESFRNFLVRQRRVLNELNLKGIDPAVRDFSSLYRFVGAIAFFVGFVLVASYVGYYLITSFIFLLGLSITLWPTRIKRSLPVILIISVGVSLVVYSIFSAVFNVVFP
jgi:tripartite-type tricarboxylate transporter receptor subunit TctC